MNPRLNLLCLLVLALLFCTTGSASADTYVVNPDGSGDFATIQDALDSGHSGDIIELGEGTFTGSGNSFLYVDYDLTLRSQSDDPSNCIIDCQGSAGNPAWGIIFDGQSQASLMRGITVRNAYDTNPGGGIICDNAEPSIEKCILLNNYAVSVGGGILCRGEGYSPMIYNCLIAGNQVGPGGHGGGIAVDNECTPLIDYCIFSGNGAEDAGLFVSDFGSMATVRFCTFYSNDRHAITTMSGAHVEISNTIIAFSTLGAVNCDQGDPGTVNLSCSDVYGNNTDYFDCLSPFQGVNGNISLDPLFCSIPDGPFNLAENSPCAAYTEPNASCNLIGARDVNCGPHVYSLNAAGTGDFATIQAAINGAWPGSIIELADGTYTGAGNHEPFGTYRSYNHT